MTEQPLRFGVLGLGNWGDRLATTVAALPGAEIASCFARSPQRRQSYAERHNCRAAGSLEDFLSGPIDAVLIATPHTTHVELVVAAAVAGKHVMVEKPLALTVAGARECIAAADAAGVILQVAHYRRRLPATRRLREVIDKGLIGQILHASGWFSRAWGVDLVRPWRDDPAECPLGGMTSFGIHMVDNLHYLVGRVESLTCLTRRLTDVNDLDDVTVAMLAFESGAVGTVGTSVRTPLVASTAVFGTVGSAWSEEDGTRFFYQARDDEVRREQPVEKVDGVLANLEAFTHSIRTSTPPETGGAEALEVVAVLEAMIESAEAGGAVIEVEEVRRQGDLGNVI
ncbi:MAG: Gfo/Idh/MocA family oxidoreductase [Acidimicrobiia bacterium]|nr:Gfo/Idh/MocA family oxidoreductase [Acidimicrobiia bacterium]